VSGNTMRAIVVGLGIQGKKRLAIAGAEAVATVDPVNETAAHRSIRDIPLASYEAALVCTPDAAKLELLEYLLGNGKHVLVEKPLLAEDDAALERLAALARRTSAICYTAYNHRFEPHFVRMKETIESGLLGRIENRAFDHVTFGTRGIPVIELEMSLLSWRNDFTCDVYGESGSAHISSLCKWGPSTFTRRTRVLPSGRPPEEAVTLVQPDPTWTLEYDHFKAICASGRGSNIDTDILINGWIAELARQALGESAR
jgi:scyllo-inositol 2-dehydrogenase (NADP+)